MCKLCDSKRRIVKFVVNTTTIYSRLFVEFSVDELHVGYAAIHMLKLNQLQPGPIIISFRFEYIIQRFPQTNVIFKSWLLRNTYQTFILYDLLQLVF